MLAECKELITKLNIPDSSLEMLGEKYANEITSFNSYKKMRDNVVELDTYCNEVEALKEEERFTRKGNLMLFKEKYN
ncbi:hypothetical protein FACS189459_2360 [Bacilli bacterium]|nr:hypothetical protein FACS189459_2360 [Bacilli bacterium]